MVGFASGIALAVILQSWPSRYTWSDTVGIAVGERDGRRIYQARFGRGQQRFKTRRLPSDVMFRSRVVVRGLGSVPGTEVVVPIPVDHEWRPSVAQGVLTTLFPEHCDPRDLRSFPGAIREKRAAGTLDLEDLLAVGDAQLRCYAFAYRPYLGTRLMVARRFRPVDLKPGRYVSGRFEPSPDGRPPRRPDPLPPARLADISRPRPRVSVTVGRWSLQVHHRPSQPT